MQRTTFDRAPLVAAGLHVDLGAETGFGQGFFALINCYYEALILLGSCEVAVVLVCRCT